MAFMTLAEEAAFIDDLETSGRAAADVIGESVNGNPIRLLRIGIDPPSLSQRGVLLLLGSQHGNEPAGREGLLEFAEYLTTTTVTAETDFLAAHGVLILPTPNPDGIELGTRTNANGVDVNRHHLDLQEPENKPIADVMAAARPLMTVDHHESTAGTQVEFAQPKLDQTRPIIESTSLDLITQMKARCDAESWTNDDFGDPDGSGNEQVFISNAGIRNSCSVLVEVSRNDDTEPGQLLRTEQHYAMAEEALDYCITNAAQLLADVDQAVADSKAEGIAAVESFDLKTTILDPPPLAYQITGLAPFEHLAAFNIEISGTGIVTMGQDSQPVIPFLFDSAAEFTVHPGERLFSIPATASVATVQEFADVVYGSHRMVAEAWVMSTFQVGNNPDGTLIDIISGSVTMDATAEVFATLELETSGMDERRRSRFPRRAGDLLAPYGTEVFVRRGVDIGSEIMWSPLGYFRLNDDEQSPASDSPIRLSGQDRMSRIVKGRLAIPRQYGRSRTFAEVVSSLVTDIYPAAVIAFDDDSGEAQIGRTLLVEEDRHAALLDLAESLGKVVYFDGEGVLRIEDPPPADDLVWQLKAGFHGVLYDNTRRVSDEDMSNGIVVRGEGGDTQTPVLAIVVDAGPNSPTSWFPPDDETQLWFGQVPEFYSSPLLTTQGGAVKAGTSLLRRRIGAPYQIDWTSVVNPALRPRHAIRVTQKSGEREKHLVETLAIPLTYGRGMTGSTREQTNVRISEVQPSTLGGS